MIKMIRPRPATLVARRLKLPSHQVVEGAHPTVKGVSEH